MRLSDLRFSWLVWVVLWAVCIVVPVPAEAVPPVDVQVELSGAGASTAGPLVLNRVELLFDNGRGDATVPVGGRVRVDARISYTGNGVLSATWVVDGRSLSPVNQSLSFGTDIVLRTPEVPPLPTFEPGLHSVTLRVSGPPTRFVVPTVTYFVTGRSFPAETGITLFSPGDGVSLAADELAFSWNDPGATGLYRISVWERRETPLGVMSQDYLSPRPQDALVLPPSAPAEAASIFSALTQEQSYQPSAAIRERLMGGRTYVWDVAALTPGKAEIEVARSSSRTFRLLGEPAAVDSGGVFFRLVALAAADEAPTQRTGVAVAPAPARSPFDAGGGRTASLTPLQASLNLDLGADVAVGGTRLLLARVENSSAVVKSGVVFEARAGEELLGRAAVPDLEPNRYALVELPWTVPLVGEGSGTIQLVLLRDSRELDAARLRWTASIRTLAGGFDFQQVAAPVSAMAEIPGPDCSLELTDPAWGRLVLGRGESLPADGASARVTSLRDAAGRVQSLATAAVLRADRGDTATFGGLVSDLGLTAAYGGACPRWQRELGESLTRAAEQAEAAVRSPACAGAASPSRRVGSLPGRDRTSGGETSGALAPALPPSGVPSVAFDNLRLQGLLERSVAGQLTCASLPGIAADLLAVAQTLRTAAGAGGTAAAVPLRFRVERVGDDGSWELAWEDPSPVWLEPGAAGLEVWSGPWTAGDPGEYRATIQEFEPPAPVVVTHPGGLPARLEMGGFILNVRAYAPGSSLLGTLEGEAEATWRGDEGAAAIPLSFKGVVLEPGGDPVQPRVVGGVAGTPAGTALSLRLRGHEIRLKSLSLDAFRAVADLEYPVPAGFGAVVPAFPLRAVEVWGGGEFVAQYGFPGDTPDLALGSGELALRLAGGAFVADFSPHLGYDSYAADAAWQGVGFSGAVVRARVQARPERPEVGLFPVADSTRAFLYGRVGFLSLAPDGGLEGVAHTLPPSDVAAFFGEGADTRFLLQAPDGFALEIDGGEFQITGGGVGGLRLAGWAVLPERYASRPLRFERLTRRLVDGRPSGFVTEEIAADLPELRIEGFIYYPAAATLSIPAEAPLVVTAPEPLASAPAGWPAQPRDRARWTAGLQARVSARAAAGSGLLLIGGTLDLPWADGSLQPAAVTRLAEAEAGAVASPSSGARTDRFATAGATLPTLELQAARAQVAALEEARYEGGAFLLDDAGAIGAWLTLDEPHYKRVGEFSGRIAGAYLEFLASSLVDSRIGGALVIPYPAALEVGFEGSLDAAGEVLVSDLALGDGTGWALDYWKVRVVPGTGRQQPRFRGDRIEIPGAALWLEVDAAYGGSEFQTSDGRAPFAVRLDLLPDGNVGEVALSVAENPLGPGQIPVGGGPRMLFLGLEFTPEALDGADSPFAFRRYYGQGPPAPEAEPSDEWLVRVTGRIAFGLFGERKVRVHHTARGAQVPFVENVESGVRDSTGVLELFTSRVRFLNTFARDERGLAARVEQYQTQVSPQDQGPFVDTGVDLADLGRSKTFVGLTELSVLDVFRVNGLAEAGTAEFGSELRSYEKVGIGGGVDALKAVLAGIRGLRTAAKLGGAGVEIVTGVQGQGRQVVQLAAETVSVVSDIVTLSEAAAATAGTEGAASPWTAEEIRNLVGDGLGVAQSAVALANSIHKQQPGYQAADTAAICLAIAEIGLEAAQLAVQWEELDPERITNLVLATAEQTLMVIETSVPDSQVVEHLAIELGAMLTAIPRRLLEQGAIPPADLAGIFRRAFQATGRLVELAGPRMEDGLGDFLALAARIGEDLMGAAEGGARGVSPDMVLAVSEDVLDLLCGNRSLVDRVVAAGGDASGVSGRELARTVGTGLASAQLFVEKLRSLRGRLAGQAVIPPEEYVREFIFPVIDRLTATGLLSPEAEACGAVDLGPDAGMALRVLKTTLQVALALQEGEGIPGAILRFVRQALAELQGYDPSVGRQSPVSLERIGSTLGLMADELDTAAAAGAGGVERAAVRVAAEMLPLVEDVAQGLGAGQNVRAGLMTAEVLVEGAGGFMVGTAEFGAPESAALLQRLIHTISGFDALGPVRIDDTARATLAIVAQALEVVRRAYGDRALQPTDLLEVAGRVLGVLDERLAGQLAADRLVLVRLARLVVGHAQQAFAHAVDPIGTAQALAAGVARVLGTDPEVEAAVEAFGVALTAVVAPPGAEGQETLALITVDLVDRALEAGVSPEVERELRWARTYLATIRAGACDDECGTDAAGTVVICRCTDAEGVKRTVDFTTGRVLVEYPPGHPRHPGGGREHVVYPLDRLDPARGGCALTGEPADILAYESTDAQGRRVTWSRETGRLAVSDPPGAGPGGAVAGGWCGTQLLGLGNRDCTGRGLLRIPEDEVTLESLRYGFSYDTSDLVDAYSSVNIESVTMYDPGLASCIEWEPPLGTLRRTFDGGGYLELEVPVRGDIIDRDSYHQYLTTAQDDGSGGWQGLVDSYADCVTWPETGARPVHLVYDAASTPGHPTLRAAVDERNFDLLRFNPQELFQIARDEELRWHTLSVFEGWQPGAQWERHFWPTVAGWRTAAPEGWVLQKTVGTDTYLYGEGIHLRDLGVRKEFRVFDPAEVGVPTRPSPGRLPAVTPDNAPARFQFAFWVDAQGRAHDPVNDALLTGPTVFRNFTFLPGSTVIQDAQGRTVLVIDDAGAVASPVGAAAVETVSAEGAVVATWTDGAGNHHRRETAGDRTSGITSETITQPDGITTVVQATYVAGAGSFIQRVTDPATGAVTEKRWREGESPAIAFFGSLSDALVYLVKDGAPVARPPDVLPSPSEPQAFEKAVLAARLLGLETAVWMSPFAGSEDAALDGLTREARRLGFTAALERIAYLRAARLGKELTDHLTRLDEASAHPARVRGLLGFCPEIEDARRANPGAALPDCDPPLAGEARLPYFDVVQAVERLKNHVAVSDRAAIAYDARAVSNRSAAALGRLYRSVKTSGHRWDAMIRGLVTLLALRGDPVQPEDWALVFGTGDEGEILREARFDLCLLASLDLKRLGDAGAAANVAGSTLTVGLSFRDLSTVELAGCPSDEETGGEDDPRFRDPAYGYDGRSVSHDAVQGTIEQVLGVDHSTPTGFFTLRMMMRYLPAATLCGPVGQWMAHKWIDNEVRRLRGQIQTASGPAEKRAAIAELAALQRFSNLLYLRSQGLDPAAAANLTFSGLLNDLRQEGLIDASTNEATVEEYYSADFEQFFGFSCRDGRTSGASFSEDALVRTFSGGAASSASDPTPQWSRKSQEIRDEARAEAEALAEECAASGDPECVGDLVEDVDRFRLDDRPACERRIARTADEAWARAATAAAAAWAAETPDYHGALAEARAWLALRTRVGLDVCDASVGCDDLVNGWVRPAVEAAARKTENGQLPSEQELRDLAGRARVAIDVGVTICEGLSEGIDEVLTAITGAARNGEAAAQALLDAARQLIAMGFGAAAAAATLPDLYAFCGDEAFAVRTLEDAKLCVRTGYFRRLADIDPNGSILRTGTIGQMLGAMSAFDGAVDRIEGAAGSPLLGLGALLGSADAAAFRDYLAGFLGEPGVLPDNDPYLAMDQALAAAIDRERLYLERCDASAWARMLDLVALARGAVEWKQFGMAHDAQADRALQSARDVVDCLIATHAVLPDLSGLWPDLTVIATAGEALQQRVADLLRAIFEFATRAGDDAVETLSEALAWLEGVLRVPTVAGGALSELARWLQEWLARQIASAAALLGGALDDAARDLGRLIDEAGRAIRIPDIAWPEFDLRLVETSCQERLRLAMRHLDEAARLAGNDRGGTLARAARHLYQDHALWSIDTPHTVAAKATVRAGQFLATVLGARAGQAAQDTVAAVVDVSVRLATEGIQAQVLFQDLLGTFSFDGGGGGSDPLGIAEGLLAGLFQGMGDPGVDFDRVLGQMQAGLAQAPNRLLADVASLMDALYAAPTAPPKDVARVLAAVGGALQSPVAGWLRDAGAPRPVPQLVGGVGGILAQADTPDFYLLAAATVGRTLAETFLPDQAGVVETLDWSAEFLAKYAARDLEGKLRALQAPDGLQDLGSRLEQRAGLPIPTVLVRAPLAGVLELAQRAGEMQSQSGQTAALGHVTAAVLNQVLPAVPTDSAVGTEPSRSFRCSAADGVEQHPAACLIRAVAEAGASGTSGSRQDFIRSAILLVTVAEDWALAGQGQAELRVTPLLWILHDLAEAGGSPEEVALTALIELPKLTQRVLAMADANPNWQPVLRLFGGDCSSASSRLSPPDQCGRNGLVNVLLAVLAEARIDTLATLPSPLGIPYGHLNDLEWGYLKTVPVLRPPAGSGASGDALSMAPDVGPSLDPASWEAMGENLGDPQKALVGGIDLARVFLNLASVLDGSRPDNYNRFAGEIIESSVFASLVGEEGEFFSGIAGGLLQHGQVGGTRGDLYLELLGQTKLPALTTIAAQASFRRSDETGAWGLRFRSGGDVPDVANLVDGFDGVGAAASAFDTVARTLDANAPVGLEWDLDAFLGAAGSRAILGGRVLVKAQLLGSNLGTLAMRGDLAVPDLTGQMCVRGSGDILATTFNPWIRLFSPLLGGWAPIPEAELSSGGGLWNGSAYGGTGAAYMFGFRSGADLDFLGVNLTGLSLGVNVGGYLTGAAGGGALGQCLTPYLNGHLGVAPFRYTIDVAAPVKAFVKTYGGGRVGLGFTAAATYLDHLDQECTGTFPNQQCRPKEKRASVWLFTEEQRVCAGVGPFPRSGDLVACWGRDVLTQVQGWGGEPAGSSICDPYEMCGYPVSQ